MTLTFWLSLLAVVVTVTAREKFFLNEHWVCAVKGTCIDCLQLPHCSWCEKENKCFSKKLSNNFCNNQTDHEDYGFSLEENAACSCAGGKMELHCYPEGVTQGPECSNRGNCVCGHCICDPSPDPKNPTKVVMGEYCEFDNFSCDGPKCNEGPYSLTHDDEYDTEVVDIPSDVGYSDKEMNSGDEK